MDRRANAAPRGDVPSRSDVLAAADFLLRYNVDRLTALEDVDDFLSEVLLTIQRLLEGERASVWRRDPRDPGEYVLALAVQTDGALSPQPSTLRAGDEGGGSTKRWIELAAVAPEDGARQRKVEGDGLLGDGEKASLLQQGVRSYVTVNLMLADSLVGVLIVRLAHERPVLDEHLELIERLARRAAVAVHISSLARGFAEAAIARALKEERQARVADLARAHAAIAHTKQILSGEGDLQNYLRRLLSTVLDPLECDSGALWLAGPEGRLRLQAEIREGRHVVVAEDQPSGSLAVMLEGLQAERADVHPDLADPASLLDEATRDDLLTQGLRALILIPLFSGGRRLGAISVSTKTPRTWTPEQIMMAQALAAQAEFAIERHRLTDEARDAALMREREAAAAKARADKLALANGLLRETSERLGAIEDIDAFLRRILLTMYEVVGGHSATLWLVDPTDPNHYLLHNIVEAGRVVPAAESSHPRRDSGSTPNDRARLHPQFRAPSGRPVQVDLVNDGSLHHDDERAYLLGMGIRSIVWVPLVLPHRVLGHFTIRLTDDRQLLEEDLELIQALAGQATVALNLARLAEEAKQAAVAKEREGAERNRADALHKANAALRTMLERIARQQDVTAFLGEALTIYAREMGAVGAGIWVRLSPGEHGLILSSEAGNIRAPVPGEYLAKFSVTSESEDLSRGKIVFRPVSTYAREIADWDSLFHGFHEAQKAVVIASVPMFVGGRWIGELAFPHTSETRDYPPERAELALAFGNQIALALELQRLADAARVAALSEERAVAARQRSEAAERTAETLRASLDLLAAEPELERFLGHVMRAANTQLNVNHSTLWLYDPDQEVNRLHMTCDEGRITIDPVDANVRRILLPASDWGFWAPLIEKRRPLAFDDAPNHPALAKIQDSMRMNRIRSLLVVPLMLGAEILGVVGIHNTERESWTEDEINLAQAMGHQATLALQLTRLATRAREGAVLQERNRLAREIHDTLAQGFAAIRMQLELARGERGLSAKAAVALDAASEIAGENIVEARRSLAVLTTKRPTLATALSAAVEGVRRLGGTEIVADIGDAPEPPPDVAHELQRICQEAMLNAVRHAQASTVRVTLSAAARRGVRISVADNGKGFDLERVTKGFGLGALRERASAIDAELTIVSEPGQGAEVIVTWAPA